MNIEDVVRIHENIRKWLVQKAIVQLLVNLSSKNEITQWANNYFNKYIMPEDDAPFSIIKALLPESVTWDMIGTTCAYLRTDIKKLRSIDVTIDPNNHLSELVSNLKIAQEFEKRDEGLCRVYGSLFEMFEANARKCNTFHETRDAEPSQILQNLSEYAKMNDRTRAAHCWACLTSTDDLKAGLSTPIISDIITIDLIYKINDRWQRALRDSRKKDAQISGYIEDKRSAEKEASMLKEELVRIKANNAALEERVKELESKPKEPALPPDVEQLKIDLEYQREMTAAYEQEIQKLNQQIADLRTKNSALEARLGRQQPNENQNSAHDLFAAYVKGNGYDPELTSTIIVANREFLNKHDTPHFKKNTQEHLKNKSLMDDYDRTLKWLISQNVVLVKEGIGTHSINTHFSDINGQPLRNYVAAVINRQQ